MGTTSPMNFMGAAFCEVWIDPNAWYLLIVVVAKAGHAEVIDPVRPSNIRTFESYEDAHEELREDEYERVEGRIEGW